MWEARDFRRNNTLLSVDCLLLDEKANAIHASIHHRRLHNDHTTRDKVESEEYSIPTEYIRIKLFKDIERRVPFTPPHQNQLHLKIIRPLRQEYNISYTIPFTNNQIIEETNSSFKQTIKFFIEYHDIDDEITCTLTETLIDFIETAVLSPEADTTNRLHVFFEIEDHNPNSSRRLDVDLVITDLETTQAQASEEEHGDCPICLDKQTKRSSKHQHFELQS
ncbi:unnamed protein product [Microthlaspi erraticum]|uniref:Uncharacterized protein n=1 Tax=Microthlaspi erraticum TaxID=1685480 RepID=A0A6D2HT90_9BRAS|nr:unnamed protein product [Microthlaspi erraticum]